MTSSEPGEQYRISIRGIVMYLALWAMIFAVVRVLSKYSSIGSTGSYPNSAGLVTQFVLPVAIGLVFVAIGVAVGYCFGKKEHVSVIAICCFLAGVFLLPMVWIIAVVLNGLGIIDLD